jgi:hypothetical protein
MIYLWLAISVIICAGIDAWRRKRVYGKVYNINHWVSYALAVLSMAGIWIAYNGFHFLTWRLVTFILTGVFIRGVLFDIALNLFCRERLDKQSTTSNSLNDSRLTKIPFWWRRAGYAALLAIVLIINYFL